MIRGTKILFWSLALVVVVCGLYPAQANMKTTSAENAVISPCLDCHLCDRPTAGELCLKVCSQAQHSFHPAHYKGPEPGLIQLGQPGGIYEPVAFDHESHADMGSMGDGCSTCHHYTPDGHIPPCSDCHLKPAKLGQPGLKGAYHRQCLGCHVQWSGSTECSSCHIPIEPASISIGASTRAQGKVISASAFKPDKKVYSVSSQIGEKVTFYHNDHVEKFGVECVTCHQRESCGYCHDPNGSTVPMKSAKEIHGICNDCHDGDNCKLCHGEKEKTPFKHDASHWRLGEYHRHLPCRSCHEVGQRIKSLRADCSECHSDWGPDNFDHQVTGLKLDEIHEELDCTDCHSLNKYHQPPTCIDCHDENRTPRATPPGVKVSGLFGNDDNAKEVN